MIVAFVLATPVNTPQKSCHQFKIDTTKNGIEKNAMFITGQENLRS